MFGESSQMDAAYPNFLDRHSTKPFIRTQIGGCAYPFIRGTLDYPRELSKTVLEIVPIEAGAVFSFLPSRPYEEVLTKLEQGWYIEAGESARCLVEFIRSQFAEDLMRICILESNTWRRGEGPCRTSPSRIVFLGDEVYYVCMAPDKMENIERAIRESEGGGPWLGIIASVTPQEAEDWMRRTEVSKEELRMAVSKLTSFFVSAWDNEGYLYWQPVPKESRTADVTPSQ